MIEPLKEQNQNMIYDEYHTRIKSKLYGILCEKEKNGEWEKIANNLLIELSGYSIEQKTSDYYELFSKISSLKILNYPYFRKTIFNCMDLVDGLEPPGDYHGLL